MEHLQASVFVNAVIQCPLRCESRLKIEPTFGKCLGKINNYMQIVLICLITERIIPVRRTRILNKSIKSKIGSGRERASKLVGTRF